MAVHHPNTPTAVVMRSWEEGMEGRSGSRKRMVWKIDSEGSGWKVLSL
jgi:hypothetical protein